MLVLAAYTDTVSNYSRNTVVFLFLAVKISAGIYRKITLTVLSHLTLQGSVRTHVR